MDACRDWLQVTYAACSQHTKVHLGLSESSCCSLKPAHLETWTGSRHAIKGNPHACHVNELHLLLHLPL